VNGLKNEFPNQLRVISVDVQSALGEELTREYGSFTPTFVFFEPQGKELWRMVGTIDPEKVKLSLQ
jgi:thioredoxin-related protein